MVDFHRFIDSLYTVGIAKIGTMLLSLDAWCFEFEDKSCTKSNVFSL